MVTRTIIAQGYEHINEGLLMPGQIPLEGALQGYAQGITNDTESYWGAAGGAGPTTPRARV